MGKVIKKLLPVIVAIVAPYAAAALGLTGFAATAFSFVLQTAVSSLFAPDKPGGGGSSVQDSGFMVNKTSNVAAVPVLYGQRRLGGTRVYLQTTNSSGAVSGTQYLHLVVALAQGASSGNSNGDTIDDLVAIQFNNAEVWNSTSGYQGEYNANNTTFYFYKGKGATGAEQSPASPDVSAGSFTRSAEWTSNHKMNGVAYIYCILKYDRDVFPGAPIVTCDLKGKKIKNVANLAGGFTNTASEMSNPANVIYDYLVSNRYGKGLDASLIDDSSFQAARTWANSAGIKFNGAINTSDTIFNNVQKMLSSSNMNLVYNNGTYQLLPINQLTFDANTFTFSTANIIGGWQIALGNKKSRFNTLKVNFFNPDLDWQPDSVLIENSTYLTEDSNVLNEKTIDLPLVADATGASGSTKTLVEKMGTYYLNTSRYQKIVTFKASHDAMKLAVGDPVYVTHDVPGWTNEKFRVNSITLNGDATVEVILEEYAPDSIYLENN